MSGVCSCKATPGTRASTLFNFLNFQNHREHVYNNLWKFHRNRMNGVCSCRERTTPGTPPSIVFYFLNFQNHGEHVYNNLWKYHRNRRSGVCSYTEHTHTHTHRNTHTQVAYTDIDFIYRLNFQHHREHVYNNFWKFHRNRMNGVCSYTEHTHTHTDSLHRHWFLYID